jgi:hypothetical protein
MTSANLLEPSSFEWWVNSYGRKCERLAIELGRWNGVDEIRDAP